MCLVEWKTEDCEEQSLSAQESGHSLTGLDDVTFWLQYIVQLEDIQEIDIGPFCHIFPM